MEDQYANPVNSRLQALLLCESDTYRFFNNHPWSEFIARSTVIKKDKDRTILQALLPCGSKVFAKVYKEKGVRNLFRRLTLGARAKQSHLRTLSFIDHKITTPNSYGYLLHKHGCLNVESVHFCCYLNDSQPLSIVFNEESLDEIMRQRLLVNVAQLLNDLHAVGYIHGDAKLTNILLSDKKLYFVDLDGVRRQGVIARPERDVARLLVGLSELNSTNKADRLLFFDSYCNFSVVDKIQFADKVMRLVEKFQHRHQLKYGLLPVDIF